MDQASEVDFPLYLILGGITGMLLLALAIIVFFLIYQKRLHAQQEALAIMERDYQKNLLQYSFEAQEAERKRIASDLHDEIGGILSASRIYVHQMNPTLAPDNYIELKTETTGMIDEAINKVRSISHNLFPPNLDHLGLAQAVTDFFQRLEKVEGLKIQLEINEIPELTKIQELALYRILQELVNNTLKHAQATLIKLTINSTRQGLKMSYIDNGVGFETAGNQKTGQGIGLKSIESRANSIGAQMSMTSAIGQGLRLELLLAPTHPKPSP